MPDLFFTSSAHKQRWLATMQRLGKIDRGKVDPEYASALYILTADVGMWHVAQKHVARTGIDINVLLATVGLSSGESIMVKLAGNLLNGNQSINPVAFTRLDEHNFRLALDAISLRYYGGRVEDFQEG